MLRRFPDRRRSRWPSRLRRRSAVTSLGRDKDAETHPFDFTKRNRRPPTDPVNTLLSCAYSLLVRTWTVALTAVGFERGDIVIHNEEPWPH